MGLWEALRPAVVLTARPRERRVIFWTGGRGIVAVDDGGRVVDYKPRRVSVRRLPSVALSAVQEVAMTYHCGPDRQNEESAAKLPLLQALAGPAVVKILPEERLVLRWAEGATAVKVIDESGEEVETHSYEHPESPETMVKELLSMATWYTLSESGYDGAREDGNLDWLVRHLEKHRGYPDAIDAIFAAFDPRYCRG